MVCDDFHCGRTCFKCTPPEDPKEMAFEDLRNEHDFLDSKAYDCTLSTEEEERLAALSKEIWRRSDP